MKNVLFATTALVAFAGVASAEASLGFSGEVTIGYNDEVESGLFYDFNIDFEASIDMGDNVVVTVDGTLQEGDQTGVSVATLVFQPTVEVAYSGDMLSASLKAGDLGDKGASEYFYADRSGMAADVENHDDGVAADIRALVEFGNFGAAVGCDDITDGDCNTGMNVGVGATFGSIELGVGYDDGAGGQQEVTAVSADATFGAAEIGVSYASGAEDSIGVEIAYEVSDALSVGAYYASNSTSDDGYGVNVDYTAGALTLGVYFDHTPAATDEYGIDVSYAVTDQLTANAGYLDGEAEFFTAPGVSSDVVGSYFYAGIDYAVNDNISATVSYAEAHEFGAAEYKQGITALITASF